MEANESIKTFLKAYSVYMKVPLGIVSSLIQRRKDAHTSKLEQADIDLIRYTVQNMEHKLAYLRIHFKETRH